MGRPRYISLPIILVLLTIGYLYYATVFVVIDGWLGMSTAAGLMNAAAFSGLAFICVVTYVMAISRDPGHVPSTFAPDIEDPGMPIHEIKRKGGDLRYCQKCSHHKPARAHHCRVCKRCILRMDHHCVWINNCVGHANYKVFFVFVLHAVLACLHAMAMLVGSAAYGFHTEQQQTGGSFRTSYIICGVLLFPLTLALSILLGWHIYLILQNKTTIEYHEGVRAMWLAEKVGNIYRHPYDLGAYENLVSCDWGDKSVDSVAWAGSLSSEAGAFAMMQILGPNILCWICPTSGHIGSGLRFRTSYDSTLPEVPR